MVKRGQPERGSKPRRAAAIDQKPMATGRRVASRAIVPAVVAGRVEIRDRAMLKAGKSTATENNVAINARVPAVVVGGVSAPAAHRWGVMAPR